MLTTQVFEESCKIFPGGVNSPIRAFTALGISPLVTSHGNEAHIIDINGKRYIDYCGSFGALILGHSPASVMQAASKQLSLGTTFGTATPYELSLGLKIQKHFPSLEKLRFVSSGTEAVMSAIRVARAFTQKPGIIKFNGHYHGHLDSLLVHAGSGVSYLQESSSAGVPSAFTQHTASLPFNDKDTLLSFLNTHDDIAAIILEPIAGNMGVVPAHLSFLHLLRKETKKTGDRLDF